MTGSLSVVGNGITSSLFGTSSWASNSISASQAQNAVTASYILNAVSASFASTASNVLGGAANYIPLWNTATSLSSSVIYQSSGNVGIGTTSPVSKLVIEADGAANTYAGVIRISNTNANRWGYIGLPDTQTTLTEANNYYLIGRGASTTDRVMSFHIPTTSNYGSGNQPKFGFYSTGVDLLSSIEASTGTVYFKGNVGIGTTTPNAKLDVSGSSIISGSLTVNPGSGNELVVSSTGLSIGNIVSDVHNVTGSLRISGSVITTGSVSATNFTGSLFGTSSWASNAVSSSFALSASWAPVAGTTVFPYTGSALFTGSIILTGSLTTSLNANIGGNASVSGSLVVSGSQYTYGVANTALSATNVITSISTGSYRAAFFNYVMTSGSNARAGQIASVWYINTCSFSETITTDIGSTVGQEMSARISGSFIQLVASSSANWTIDASVNLI
jgi:hypothetical protein